MSVSDYGLMFSMLLIVCILFHSIHLSDYMAIQKVQADYNMAVDEAVEFALHDSVRYDNENEITLDEKEVIQRFFHACYMNLGIMENPVKKELCRFYVPYMLFVESDGIVPYIQASSQVKGEVHFINATKIYYEWKGEQNDTLQVTLGGMVRYENDVTLEHKEGLYRDVAEQLPKWFRWSEHEFLERKKKLVIGCIKNCTNACINHQNQIAKNFGIHYRFTLPQIKYEEWYRTIEDVSLITLFQGYPYGNGVTGVFNRVAIGGARVVKASVAGI